MHRSLLLSLTATISLLSSAFPCLASDYTDGQKLYQQRDFRGAAGKFEAAMKANPRDANIIYYCALASQMSSNRARARQLYEYLVNNFPLASVSQMAQAALSQLGPMPGAAGHGSGTIGGGATSASYQTANSDPTYLAGLPDDIRVPLLRHGSSLAAYVEVSVNGRPVVFHVDTGAYMTLIGANQLEQIGLTKGAPDQQVEITGVGDRQHVKGWHRKLDLKLGPIIRRDFDATIQDNLDTDPLLGQDFLRDFNLTVDDRAGQIIFRKKNAHSSTVIARGALDIPYTMAEDGRHLLVDAYVNRKRYPMIFDTGASGVAFSKTDFKKLGIPLPDCAPNFVTSGVMGDTNTWSVTLDSLKVGPVSKENFPVMLLESTKMDKPLLGQSFFGNYKYTVDAAKNVIHLVEQD